MICDEIKNISKPVIGILIGGDPEILRKAGATAANTLEEASLLAVAVSKGSDPKMAYNNLENRKKEIQQKVTELTKNAKGKYLRGLFSGGTLCDEAQLIMKESLGFVYSNSPLNPDYLLKNLWKSQENTIIDLGEDEFTSGRPHPMIDFSIRQKRIIDEASDKEVAVILLDVVLGFGSNLDPASELIPAIIKAKEISPSIIFICSVTGTDGDPQNRKKVAETLQNAGVIVMPSNAAAAELAEGIIIALNQ
jgi:FdrA protein